jgi:crossover junction endodeoxyribonuclease RusA
VIILELPFPPSLNTYWRRGKGKVYINERGLEFRQYVATYVRQHKLKAPEGFLTYAVWLYPPDKRRRDGDNFAFKAIWDSLTHAQCIEDDSLFKEWSGTWMPVVKGGLCRVFISEYQQPEDK